MDGNAPMDIRLHQRMRSLPTKQDPNPPEEDTPLPNHNKGGNPSFSTNCNGSYYGTSAAPWTQRHTNHSRPRVLVHSHLPSMFRYHNRPWNRSTLPRLCLPMVWSTNQNDKRLRPQIHLTIRKGPHQETRHPMKPIDGLPFPNRWTLGTKEPMGETIPTTCNLERPQGMDTLACPSYSSTQ